MYVKVYIGTNQSLRLIYTNNKYHIILNTRYTRIVVLSYVYIPTSAVVAIYKKTFSSHTSLPR